MPVSSVSRPPFSRLSLTWTYKTDASVAAFNFLSTTCQYQALRYVSYTTQSLAKTSKMVPVLVVGAVVWKKTHATREWVAGGVILAGCVLASTMCCHREGMQLSSPSQLCDVPLLVAAHPAWLAHCGCHRFGERLVLEWPDWRSILARIPLLRRARVDNAGARLWPQSFVVRPFRSRIACPVCRALRATKVAPQLMQSNLQ